MYEIPPIPSKETVSEVSNWLWARHQAELMNQEEPNYYGPEMLAYEAVAELWQAVNSLRQQISAPDSPTDEPCSVCHVAHPD